MSTAYEVPGRMQLLAPIEQAIARVKFMLFQPFDIAVWFQFGIIIFLSKLFSSGGGTGFMGGMPSRNLPHSDQTREFLLRVINSPATYVLLAMGVLVFVCISGVFLWLRSRGDLMLVRAAARNRPQIGENWDAVAANYLSLFWFRLVLFVIELIINGTLTLVIIFKGVHLYLGGATDIYIYVLRALYPVLMLMLSAATFLSIRMLVFDFIVPLMFQFNEDALPAWRRFYYIARYNIAPLLLFYVVKGLYSIVIGAIMVAATCLTCCTAMIPVISQTLFAPLHLFDRLFSLYVISAMGGPYDIMSETPPPMPDLASEVLE